MYFGKLKQPSIACQLHSQTFVAVGLKNVAPLKTPHGLTTNGEAKLKTPYYKKVCLKKRERSEREKFYSNSPINLFFRHRQKEKFRNIVEFFV